MPDAIITVDGLGKRYRLGGRRAAYFTLRDAVAGTAGRLAGALRGRGLGAPAEDLWALRDVSFEVRPGEVVGVIGRNGAGKSTLLRILSRITEPTEGRAVLRGRVGSLLEVGTGFHPELTGRENILMSGAILGMRRAEIARRFDEIVAFAGVEKFLDTPCKHYSSGMYVRLGFAVAAHLDPEILLVDEVLAVGDAEFQRKCLGKMGEVARGGRTILFVSHNMMAVENLCSRAVVLSEGRVFLDADAATAVRAHTSGEDGDGGLGPPSRCRSAAGVDSVWFEGPQGRELTAVCGDPLTICMRYEIPGEEDRVDWGMTFYGISGDPLVHFGSMYTCVWEKRLPPKGVICCTIPRLPLAPGRYRLNVSMHKDGVYIDHVVGAATLDVVPGDFYKTGRIPPASDCRVQVDHSWQLRDDGDGR